MLALSSSISLWAASRWSSPPGGVGGRRCMNRCIRSTKHLKKRPARLASRSALFCSHCLRMGSGAAAPETTLHCSTSKSNLLSQWASRLGQHAWRDTCGGAQTGRGDLPPCSRWPGLPPLVLPVIGRYFLVAFQKGILKSSTALQSEPSGPGDRPGNPLCPSPLRRVGGELISASYPAFLSLQGGSDKHGCLPCVLPYIWSFHCPGFVMPRGFGSVSAKGPGSVVAAVEITRTAKICLIYSSASNSFPH